MTSVFSSGFLILAAAPLAFAAPAEPALGPVRLDGPEVARLAWDTRGLAAADFDGDGKLDTALLNNENGKLVLLYQRVPGSAVVATDRRAVSRDRWEPQLEDTRFQKVSLPTDQRHFALAAGDFDGDGRPDLAMTGATDALTVRFQGESAGFSKTWTWRNFEPLQGMANLVAADLDGDGKADLAVLGKNKLLVFRQLPAGGFGEPVSYLTTEDKAGYLTAEDVDGDKKLDLLYIAATGEGSLRLRRQIAPGAFSSEMSLDYAVPAHGMAPGRDAAGHLTLTKVNNKSRLIERHALIMDAPGAIQEDKLLPTLHAPPGGVKSALHASGDFNGDGLLDIAQADGKAAQVSLYFQQADGTFGEPQTFPSLSNINGLSAARPEAGKPHVIVVTSNKEGVGVSALSAQGRLEFPVLQPMEGAPAGVTELKLPEGRSLPVVMAEKDKTWTLQTLQPGADGKWTAQAQTLKALKREPSGLRTGDLNGDGREDLLVLLAKEPALVLLAKADGTGLADPLKETPSIKSQLSDLTPDRVAIIDLDGDKRGEIVTASTGFARSLRLTPEGNDVVIVDQFNARQPEDKLTAPVFCDTDSDGTAELLFQETGTAFWQALKKDRAGVYRSSRRLQSDLMETTAALSVKLGREGRPYLLALGRDRFWTAPLSGTRPGLTLTASYETDLKGCNYYHVSTADLNNDGQEEIIAFDADNKLMEVLHPGGLAGDGWKSLLHFVMFEENIHFRGRKGEDNVREVLTRDFTGDGKPDILVLLHDRVLLYPQS
ncbi:MAG: VCBS repeat-containing protein [Verrucomicrobiota bacterium]